MPAFIDITGQRFGRLVVVGIAERRFNKLSSHSRIFWRCRCDCGDWKIAEGTSIKSGETNSCGCLRRERTAKLKYRHGAAGTAEYSVWASMWNRCRRPSGRSECYAGISVCDRWKSFENFLADVGERPSPRHSIDRYPNNEGDYEPGNVRWATPSEQVKNRRRWKNKTWRGRPVKGQQ